MNVSSVRATTKKNTTDPSINPIHYKSHVSGIEAIQITEWMTANVAQAMQYLWRLGLKGQDTVLSDLRKTVWFSNRELMRLGGESMLKDGLEGPPVLGNKNGK